MLINYEATFILMEDLAIAFNDHIGEIVINIGF